MMRSNSGKDESRDNLHDPTIRDRERERARGDDEAAIEEREPKAPADHRGGRKDYRIR